VVSDYGLWVGRHYAVIAFMTWMWLSATVVLVGAAIDVEVTGHEQEPSAN
jgi:uncharacterized BrkB/YihY/UPF0761 family membrane protein